MSLITIREHPGNAGANAVVSFDHGAEHPLIIADPYSPQEEAELGWYFEEYLRFPFVDQMRFKSAAAGIPGYGEALFRQVFADAKAHRAYGVALAGGLENMAFEIKGSPEFHHLHWEALKDPELPRAFALDCPVLRRNLTPPALEHPPKPSDTLRVLLVTSRPFGDRDVGYRTISRPLVEALENASLPVDIHILRPGSYRALEQHLQQTRDRHGAGWYHIAHFDVHGAVLSHEQLNALSDTEADGRYLFRGRYGRSDIAAYEGMKGFLFLDGEGEEQGEPTADHELAALLTGHGIHAVALNACQSGKQVGGSESSLGARLMLGGVQWVLAMGYSVTVSAAECLMTTLYRQLFDGDGLSAATRRARLALHNDKERRVYYDQRIDLEDWVLPVVYENRPVALALTAADAAALARRLARRAGRYVAPKVEYGFHGRDLDILRIERRLLADNRLLLRGMAGAGKSTLLRHLAQWWQTTQWVEGVWYFSFEDRAWPLDLLLHRLALGDGEPGGLLNAAERQLWPSLPAASQQALIVERLRAARHLLILDNLESVTGASFAIPNTLDAAEQAHLRAFAEQLADGRSLLLLGSRGPEDWLLGSDPRRVYELGGLGPEATSTLAERVLERHGAGRYRTDPDLARLLTLLAGFPLAIEVVLANLATQAPGEVLAALTEGDAAIDLGKPGDQSARLLRCIEYSHGRLDPGAQDLLACLAPFRGVLFQGLIGSYTESLRRQAALADLPCERWPEVLAEAARLGLATPHEIPGYLRLQPILPWFLRRRLAGGSKEAAILSAFRETLAGFGMELAGLLQSKSPQERQTGQLLARLEYENLTCALDLALLAQASFLRIYGPLSFYLDTAHDAARGLELGQRVMAHLDAWPKAAITADVGTEIAGVIDDVAKRYLLLKRYAEAAAAYGKALALIDGNASMPAELAARGRASVYHQLGRVAQEQRQWPQAEDYYRKALDIYIDFKDRHSQAATYHQLGIVAQEQRQWPQAEDYYRKALDIYIDFKDRYEQAGTYHQLGRVAQEQRQWPQAEDHYRKALDINIEFKDRHSQAGTYHELGIVAQEQRQWPQAEDYYRKALDIKIDFKDRHSQAGTYHQLGRVAQAQDHAAEALNLFLKALAIYRDFEDSHNFAICLRSLARLRQATPTLAVPERIAETLATTPEQATVLLTQAVENRPS